MCNDKILNFVLAGWARQGQVFVLVERFRAEMVTHQAFLLNLKTGPKFLCDLGIKEHL
jgi:hypothetical protein